MPWKAPALTVGAFCTRGRIWSRVRRRCESRTNGTFVVHMWPMVISPCNFKAAMAPILRAKSFARLERTRLGFFASSLTSAPPTVIRMVARRPVISPPVRWSPPTDSMVFTTRQHFADFIGLQLADEDGTDMIRGIGDAQSNRNHRRRSAAPDAAAPLSPSLANHAPATFRSKKPASNPEALTAAITSCSRSRR